MKRMTMDRLNDIADIAMRGHASDPVYRAIQDARNRFLEPLWIDTPDGWTMPNVLRFPRPKDDIEEAVQTLAAAIAVDHNLRPVLIDYTDTAPPRQPLRHAWRFAKRTMLPRLPR